MRWSDLLAALALYLVIEGMLPFLNPAVARRALARLAALSEAQLRLSGFISMTLGAVVLYLVRA